MTRRGPKSSPRRRCRERVVYVVTDRPVRARAVRGCARLRAARGVLRGAWAVVALVLLVADRLATAVVGVPPISWMARRAAAVLAAAYRRARHGATWPAAPIEVSIVDGHVDGRGEDQADGGVFDQEQEVRGAGSTD